MQLGKCLVATRQLLSCISTFDLPVHRYSKSNQMRHPCEESQGLRIRKDYCTNDDIQSVEDNGVRTSAEVPLK